jgi:hypothetical protein
MPRRLAPYRAHCIVQVRRPSPLFVAAVLGTDSLRIEFPRTLNSACWLRYSLAKLRDIHEMWEPTSIVINMFPDMAISYSLTGEVLAVLDAPVTVPFVYTSTIH